MNKNKKNVFLRKGVRRILTSFAETHDLRANRGPSVPALLRTLADREWTRPPVSDYPVQRVTKQRDDRESQAMLDVATYQQLSVITVELGFASVQEMLEDFAAGSWERDLDKIALAE